MFIELDVGKSQKHSFFTYFSSDNRHIFSNRKPRELGARLSITQVTAHIKRCGEVTGPLYDVFLHMTGPLFTIVTEVRIRSKITQESLKKIPVHTTHTCVPAYC